MINPAEVAVPLSVSGFGVLPEPVAVGRAIDCTNVPDVVYSSRKMAVPAEVNDAEPSPNLSTTKFPGVNAAAWVGLGQSVANPAITARLARVLDLSVVFILL